MSLFEFAKKVPFRNFIQNMSQVLSKCLSKWIKLGLSQKSLARIKRIFLFRVPMNPQKDWKAKLERAHFFKVRSDRITVCLITYQHFHFQFFARALYGGEFRMSTNTFRTQSFKSYLASLLGFFKSFQSALVVSSKENSASSCKNLHIFEANAASVQFQINTEADCKILLAHIYLFLE